MENGSKKIRIEKKKKKDKNRGPVQKVQHWKTGVLEKESKGNGEEEIMTQYKKIPKNVRILVSRLKGPSTQHRE